ncbi:hypothetical protein ABTZ99_17865 [Actinosynnema sp. NPDC002837]
MKGDQIDLRSSGKAHAHGGNVQPLSAPTGIPPTGHTVVGQRCRARIAHDLTAARTQVLGTSYWAYSQLDLPSSTCPPWLIQATTPPESACTPWSTTPGNQVLDIDTRTRTRTRDALVRGLRCRGERGSTRPHRTLARPSTRHHQPQQDR